MRLIPRLKLANAGTMVKPRTTLLFSSALYLHDQDTIGLHHRKHIRMEVQVPFVFPSLMCCVYVQIFTLVIVQLSSQQQPLFILYKPHSKDE